MATKVNACLYLDRKVLENAKRAGLNVSRVSENALKEAISRLTGPKRETGLNSPARLEGRGRDLNPGARLHRPGSVDRAISNFTEYKKFLGNRKQILKMISRASVKVNT